jgi:hypothetical protein
VSDQRSLSTALPQEKILLAHFLVGRCKKLMEGRHMKVVYLAPLYVCIYIYICVCVCVCVCLSVL